MLHPWMIAVQRNSTARFRSSTTLPATYEIGAGLALLLAATGRPEFPAATGMALIALGATRLMIVRFRQASAFVAILFLHIAVYGTLYAVCIGARLDLAIRRSGDSSAAIYADLAVSLWPAAAALYVASKALNRQPSTD